MSLLISRAVIDRVRGTRPPRALGAAHQLRICVTPAEIPMSRTTTAATTSIHVRDCPAAASFRRPVQFRHDSRVGIGPVRGFGRSAPELSEPNGAFSKPVIRSVSALVLGVLELPASVAGSALTSDGNSLSVSRSISPESCPESESLAMEDRIHMRGIDECISAQTRSC
jgi:hypothetical protein